MDKGDVNPGDDESPHERADWEDVSGISDLARFRDLREGVELLAADATVQLAWLRGLRLR